MSLRYRYQTLEFGDSDIHLRTLRDRRQFSDPEGTAAELGISSASWPLFGVVWDSSIVLAQLMYHYDIAGKRILEVGCGMALSSHVLNHRLANITATDHHPEVNAYLQFNVSLNEGKPISFVRCDWAGEDKELGKFDLIIGSDLLYETEHPGLLSTFINNHANLHCEVIIVDPGRSLQSSFRNKMIALNYQYTSYTPEDVHDLRNPFKGSVLQFIR